MQHSTPPYHTAFSAHNAHFLLVQYDTRRCAIRAFDTRHERFGRSAMFRNDSCREHAYTALQGITPYVSIDPTRGMQALSKGPSGAEKIPCCHVSGRRWTVDELAEEDKRRRPCVVVCRADTPSRVKAQGRRLSRCHTAHRCVKAAWRNPAAFLPLSHIHTHAYTFP